MGTEMCANLSHLSYSDDIYFHKVYFQVKMVHGFNIFWDKGLVNILVGEMSVVLSFDLVYLFILFVATQASDLK